MKAIVNWFSKLNAYGKGIALVTGAYVITIGLVIFIISCSVFVLVDTSSCSSVTQALAALLITMAVLFLASVLAVGVAAWKTFPKLAGRLAVVGAHGVALLASFAVFAFGLMVLFNC